MTKSLSIVIPVFNEEDFIQSCLQAIAEQSMLPDEVIVVDNNSTDRSVEIAKRFPFVTVINEPHQGIAKARNAGFNAATGDIIGRIDADTVLPHGWVTRVMRFYGGGHNDDKALTGGGYFYNVPLHGINGWVQSQIVYRLNRFIVGHYVLWGSNMAVPRQLWIEVRGKTCDRNDIHEDLDLSFHLHRLGYKIAYHGNLRVGVFLKRVQGDRSQLKAHMRRWPQSLRTHHYRRWWLGVVGNWVLWYVLQPTGFAVEYCLRLLGKPANNR